MSYGVKGFRDVNCRCPHFDSLLVAFLLNHSVRRKVVCYVVRFSEASLIFSLFLVERWEKSSVENRLHKAGNEPIGR